MLLTETFSRLSSLANWSYNATGIVRWLRGVPCFVCTDGNALHAERTFVQRSRTIFHDAPIYRRIYEMFFDPLHVNAVVVKKETQAGLQA